MKVNIVNNIVTNIVGQKNIFLSGAVPTSKTFFVRPTGSTYGTGEGTSYANAWSGNANINQSLISNNRLAVCGVHTELIDITASNVTIDFNNAAEAGSINATGLNVGMRVTANNVTINDIIASNATVENLRFQAGVGNIVNNGTFNISGNQTVQHEGVNIDDVIEVTYNNTTFSNGVDDGASLHGNNTTVTFNTCHFESNSQGCNAINSGIAIFNNCTFLSNTTDVQPDSDSDFTLNRCILRNTIAPNSSVNLKMSYCLVLSGTTQPTTLGGIEINRCAYFGLSRISSNQSDASRVLVNRSYFEVGVTSKIGTINNGSYTVRYCSFKITTGTSIYAFQKTNQVTRSLVENCTVVGLANTGRGSTGIGIDFVNCIFNDLNLAFNPNGAGSITVDFCNLFDNTTKNVNQNGATFTETNAIIGDPLLTDVANLDFSLGIGSSCIGTGDTLTDTEGIATADWGNGTTETPTVTTKNQAVAWDIGAYVS